MAAASELRRATDGVSLGWLIGGPLIQLPTFVAAVMSVRRLVADDAVAAKGLSSGGALWFPDLTEVAVHVDTATAPMGVYGAILPVAVAGALFANINNAWGGAAEKSKPALALKLFMEWLTVPTLLVGLTLPQAVHMYWLPASVTALAQGAIMRTSAARKALGIDPALAHIPNRRIAERGATEDDGRAETLADAEAIVFERDLETGEAEALREAAEATAAEKTEDAERLLARAAAAETPGGKTGRRRRRRRRRHRLLSAAAHPAVLFALAQTREAPPARRKQQRTRVRGRRDGERAPGARAGGGGRGVGERGGCRRRGGAVGGGAGRPPRDVSCMISLAAVRKKQGDAREALAVLGAPPRSRRRCARAIEPLERGALGQEKNAVGFEKIDARARDAARGDAARGRGGGGENDSREGVYTPWLYEHHTPHT